MVSTQWLLNDLNILVKVGPYSRKGWLVGSVDRDTSTKSWHIGVGWSVPFSTTCTFAMSKETNIASSYPFPGG